MLDPRLHLIAGLITDDCLKEMKSKSLIHDPIQHLYCDSLGLLKLQVLRDLVFEDLILLADFVVPFGEYAVRVFFYPPIQLSQNVLVSYGGDVWILIEDG
jgi:hypothetical protein